MDGPVINITREEDIAAPPFFRRDVRTMAFLDFGGVSFITANASCKRLDLAGAGGFDEDFVWAWEDVELGTRLMESGLKRVKNRRAYVLHCKTGKHSLASQAAFRKERAEYAGKFFSKHPSPGAERMVRLRYLKYDRLLEDMGWVRRYLNEEYVSSSGGKLPSWPPMLKKLYLIHAHAEGLRKGLGTPR
jgi:GT2 family glycosyltransferase